MLTGIFIQAARAAAHVKCFVMSFLPSVILEVVYIDVIEEKVTTQYNAVANYFNWSKNYANYLMENNGYYAFTVWNSHLQKKESYFLSAPMLCRAFHLKTLYSFWAYTQTGVVEILNQFLECNRSESGDLFALLTDEADLSANSKFQPFMKTLALPENATPRAILLFYNWLEGKDTQPPEKITVYNHSLEERDVATCDYLFKRD